MLSCVERLRCRRPHDRVRVDESATNDVDDGSLVSLERRLVGVRHDLRERKADSFALATVRRRDRLLEDGDDLAEHGFSELAASLGETAGSSLENVGELRTNEQSRRPDSPRAVRYQDSPASAR